MTDTGDVTDSNLFHLATKVKAPALPHKFPPCERHKRVPPHETSSGFEQIERECPACGLNRITIMRNFKPRAYRWGDAAYQFEEPVEPECVPTIEIKREAVG